MYKHQNIELLEFKIAANATQQASKFNFPDLPRLRNQRISIMEVFYPSEVTASSDGKTPLPETDLNRAFLTLYIKDKPKIVVPLRKLQVNADNIYPFHINDQIVEWNKSYIQFSQPPSNTSENTIQLTIAYADKQAR